MIHFSLKYINLYQQIYINITLDHGRYKKVKISERRIKKKNKLMLFLYTLPSINTKIIELHILVVKIEPELYSKLQRAFGDC